MFTLGKHIIVELSKCDSEILNNMSEVKKILIEAAIQANTEIKEHAFHRFYPQGVSGVVVIAESHISIHTWPEYGYAALDIYTCGDKTEPLKACRYIARNLKAEKMEYTQIERGLEDKPGNFIHRKINTSNEEFVENRGEKNKKLILDVVSR